MVLHEASSHPAGQRRVHNQLGVVQQRRAEVVLRPAAVPIGQPPAEAPGAEAEKVLGPPEAAHLGVETDEEGVPGDPQGQAPDQVANQEADPTRKKRKRV